jgi:hypothetical protein
MEWILKPTSGTKASKNLVACNSDIGIELGIW